MTVAELFVNLGVKGADQSVKALKGTKDGLGEVKSMSLEAKAAIFGVVYGLEHMMSQSAQVGTGLLNFTSLTGISAQALQQWQYAARQAGVSGEELTGSLKAVQNSVSNMLLGKGGIEGFAMVANTVGLDKNRMRDTLYVMGQLQKFAQTVPQDVGNNMLKSFGLGEGTIAAMRRNMFTQDNFKKAPTYSDGEVNQLNKVDVAWSNLGQKIQMAMGHLTSKHGMEIVKEISDLTTQVLKLADALLRVVESFKLLKVIGMSLEGLGLVFKDMSESANAVTGNKDGVIAGIGERAKLVGKEYLNIAKYGMQSLKGAIEPTVAPAAGAATTQNIEVNQTLQFQHDGKDAKKTSGSVHKAVKDAYRQMQAQTQGN